MASHPGQNRELNRPRSVAILAGFQLLQSLFLIGFGSYRIAFFGLPPGEWEPGLNFLLSTIAQIVTSGLVLLILGLLTLPVGIQLLRLKSYAWLMSMSLQGIILLSCLIGYLLRQPSYLIMVTGVVMVFYLNQHEVQVVLRSARDEI